MQKLKTPATLAGIVTIVIMVLQFAAAQWEQLAALLLALGLSQEVIDLTRTLIVLVLTLLGAGATYQVKARQLWAE